jgi:hypothetical protein
MPLDFERNQNGNALLSFEEDCRPLLVAPT